MPSITWIKTNQPLWRNLILCIVLLAMPTIAQAESTPSPKQLSFVSVYPKDHPQTQFLILVYTEALRRLGIEFHFLSVPPRRASLMVNQGEVDAELMRVAGYNAHYPNLIPVPERNFCWEVSAYSVEATEKIKTWKDLRGKGYRVGVLRGMKYVEDRLLKLKPGITITNVMSPGNGFNMLLESRFDVFVTTTNTYENFKAHRLKNPSDYTLYQEKQVKNLGTLASGAVYSWFNKSHHSLLKPIAAELKKMKREGLFRIYYDKAGLPASLKKNVLCK